ncbi:MAG: hypothetical protein E7598_03890 [Ruminococcaceae bacterium]|nr:hypothetical protein [Oscillospiraceae bacterium]
MGYYPIKCIRCAHISTNDEVLFDTQDVVGTMGGALSKDTSGLVDDQNRTAASLFSDDDDDDNKKGNKKEKMPQYMSINELVEYSDKNGLAECKKHYQIVKITPDFANVPSAAVDEGVLVGVSFQKSKGAAIVRASRRFCPYCKCEIPTLSGSMPTYNVTIMGTSASGKTVYLSALNWLLGQGEVSPGPGRLTCISANRANAEFVNRSNLLFEEGTLPGTTQIIMTEPLVVQMTYSVRCGKEVRHKRCLFSIADMRGEDLIAQDGDNLMLRGEYFASSDAFMLLISPLNISRISRTLQIKGEAGGSGIHQTLMSNIESYILPHFENHAISKPTAIMLSKCDILMNTPDRKNADKLNIPLHNPVVAAENPNGKFTGTYFNVHNRGTQEVLRMDNTLLNFLHDTFPNSYYTSFSSLGKNVDIEEDENYVERVTNPNSIRPIRVVDPVVYILIKLGFLPELYRTENAGDSKEKKANNDRVMMEWWNRKTIQGG